MKMFQVCSTQFNYKHGKRMHFPFSIAMLTAFLKRDEHTSNSFEFKKSFIFRDKIDEYVEQSLDADILLCSCYTWNWEITLHAAKEIKKRNPNCLIILGGPQVPGRTEGFFEKHPFVDILVHGEGELILLNIFKEYLNGKDFSQVKGLETKNFRNPPESRIDEEDLPSPYLTNLIWELVDKDDSEDSGWDLKSEQWNRVEDKVDKILTMQTQELATAIADQGSSIRAVIDEVEERKKEISKKLKVNMLAVEKLIIPMLKGLMANPEREYIKWPSRGPIIQKQIDKILTLTRLEDK